jgi:hypothetical protein
MRSLYHRLSQLPDHVRETALCHIRSAVYDQRNSWDCLAQAERVAATPIRQSDIDHLADSCPTPAAAATITVEDLRPRGLAREILGKCGACLLVLAVGVFLGALLVLPAEELAPPFPIIEEVER